MKTNSKCREALELCIDEMCNRCRANGGLLGNPLPCLNGCEAVRKAKAALAETVKNCEVGTAEEQAERFDRFCDGCDRKWCGPQAKVLLLEECALRWAQMPYEEGGEK